MTTVATPSANQGRLKAQAEGTLDVFKMRPSKLQEMPGWNVREEGPELEAHIQHLMDSIREIGVKEPLKIFQKDGGIYVTNGHCRLRAVNRLIAEGAEIHTVPCIADGGRFASEADWILTMITSNSGKPLTTIETAVVLKRLLDYGWEIPEIARKTGFTTSYVADLLGLQAGPKEMVDMVKENRVSASLAVKTMKQNGREGAVEVLRSAEAVAKANGKTKVTPKHVKAHQAACAPAVATAPKLKWSEVGPDLLGLVLAIRDADGLKRETAIAAAIDFAEGLE